MPDHAERHRHLAQLEAVGQRRAAERPRRPGRAARRRRAGPAAIPATRPASRRSRSISAPAVPAASAARDVGGVGGEDVASIAVPPLGRALVRRVRPNPWPMSERHQAAARARDAGERARAGDRGDQGCDARGDGAALSTASTESSPPTPRTWQQPWRRDAGAHDRPAPARRPRVGAMAGTARGRRAPTRSAGCCAARRCQRPRAASGAGAFRRRRHDLRGPAERDRRRGGALPEERQRGPAARTSAARAPTPRSSTVMRRAAVRPPACPPTPSSSCRARPRVGQGADASPWAGRRPDPARRAGLIQHGRRGVDGAGHRDRRRQLPRVRRRARRPREGRTDLRQLQDPATSASATPRRRCWCTRASPPSSCRGRAEPRRRPA